MQKKDCYLGIAELKNILKQQLQEEVISLLVECYKGNDYVKDFLSTRYGGEMENILVVYKNKINNVFFPDNYKVGLKLSEAKRAIT